jgi:hypothetical protein
MKTKKRLDKVSVIFLQLAMFFVACLIASNVFETKQIAVGSINLTGGLLIFPLTYIICDCICEVWGYHRVCLVIWTGFLLNFLFMAVGALVDIIPGAPYYENAEGFHAIFGLAPRITLASCIAFLTGSFINARVLSGMKVRTGGKKLAGRLILSSVAGEAADSLLFFPIAFIGVLAGKEMMNQLLLQFVLKTVYEIILLPVTTWVIRKLKQYEGEDTYDRDISYGIFEVFKRSQA